jgi:glucose/arabinose dehydrogenase
MMKHFRAPVLLAVWGLMSGWGGVWAAGPDRSVPEGVWVRAGFELSVAEATLRTPRFLALGPEGQLYVSLPGAGEIRVCRDLDGDGYYEDVRTFVSGHPSAHGMFWHDGWLWFTESGAIFKARDRNGDGAADETETIIARGQLPRGGHWWRPILIHGGRLYTAIGDTGNITDETGTDRQKIWSYDLTGKDRRLFASGIRNTEKLVVRPGTDEIWGMDHGSDHFGAVLERKARGRLQPITDLNPPCEMNRYVEGGFYGHPFITGNKLPRYEFMERKDIVELAERTIPPEWSTGAHWAPNAMAFYDSDAFPGCRGDAFVAYHGSWNRTRPAGYCVTRVHFEDGRPWGEQVYVRFITPGDQVLGRPVDVAVAPDGSLLISDDGGHRIYRLRHAGPPR